MRDVLTPMINGITRSWKLEAAQRKKRTPNDAVAEAMESCASEMESELARVLRETAMLSVAQYAKQHGVDASTVRRLCVRGQLEGAEKGVDNEWRIPRDARRIQPRLKKVS